jgi:hypothetical protein
MASIPGGGGGGVDREVTVDRFGISGGPIGRASEASTETNEARGALLNARGLSVHLRA